MILICAILLIVLAGSLNGSYTTPMKFIHGKTENQIWLHFAIWAYLLIPLITFLILDHKFLEYYFLLPTKYTLIALIGGMIWGIGMVCFSLAFKHIGIGVAFAINVSLGTAGAALLPLLLLHTDKIFSLFGLFVILGVAAFILGVVFISQACTERDRYKEQDHHSISYKVGIIFAICAGLGSMSQGLSFAYTSVAFTNASELQDISLFVRSNLQWFLLFVGAFVPYLLYFLYSSEKEVRPVKAKKHHQL